MVLFRSFGGLLEGLGLSGDLRSEGPLDGERSGGDEMRLKIARVLRDDMILTYHPDSRPTVLEVAKRCNAFTPEGSEADRVLDLPPRFWT